MKIFIPGGGGYVGSALVPALLKEGHHVVTYDLFLFGKEYFDPFLKDPYFTLIEGDIRDLEKMRKKVRGSDVVIHLACISNDPSFELDPALGRSINFDPFEPFVKICKEEKVFRFVYASSSSVYGVKKEKDVSEEFSLEPLTDYSKFKAACEEILLRYASDDFICTILRPATVCGFAPRQRLDVIVNILTNHAYNKGKIKVMGGENLRPNIHIKDMVRAYIHLLKMPPEKIQKEVFNVGFQNLCVQEIGQMVQKIVSKKKNVEIEEVPTNDNRSYHISSNKIAEKLAFKHLHTIEDAVHDLMQAFEEGKLPDSLEHPRYFNIKTMQMKQLGVTCQKYS